MSWAANALELMALYFAYVPIVFVGTFKMDFIEYAMK